VDEFVINNPNFSVEIVDHGGGINDKINAALVAGSGAPDISAIGEGFITGLYKGGVAKSALTDLVPFLTAVGPDFMGKFKKWGYYTDETRVYGAEVALCHCVYYYRKDMADEAGIDPQSYETYADFIAGGQQLHETFPNSFATVADLGATDTFTPLLLQRGGGYFTPEGEVNLDCQENIEALELLYDMAFVSKMAWPCSDVWGPGMWAAMKDSTCAGNTGADWYGSAIIEAQVPDQKGLWAVAPLPRFENGGGTTGCLGGLGYCIPTQSESVDAAWELLEYGMLTKASQINKFFEVGNFPTLVDAWSDARILETGVPFYADNQKFGALLAKVAPDVPPFYASPYLLEAYNLMRLAVPIVASGEKTPEQALKDAAEELRAVIAQG